jgi:nitroimidazol reductase NimA-like FMN-containing flavoprotein (pyridoxamine 5'-phosphate oxidase superfamily)
MIVDEGLELLSEAEARRLLARGSVGRVGVTVGALPAIFPVNYRVVDGDIVFRTAPVGQLSAAANHAVLAFEVEGCSAEDRRGWSVLAVGLCEVVHDLDAAYDALAAGLEPVPEGERSSIVRIRPSFVSGRRLIR